MSLAFRVCVVRSSRKVEISAAVELSEALQAGRVISIWRDAIWETELEERTAVFRVLNRIY